MTDTKTIVAEAKLLLTPAKQKRFINQAFRSLPNKQQGLPAHNNDFCVASRAITRINKWMRECNVAFSPYSYANSIEIEMRQVVRDAWSR